LPGQDGKQGVSLQPDPDLVLVTIDRVNPLPSTPIGGPSDVGHSWRTPRNGPPLVSTPVGGPGSIGNAWRTSRKVPIDRKPTDIENSVHLFDYFDAPGVYEFELHYRARHLTLVPSASLLSLGAGGTVAFDIDAGPANAGKEYALVGSTLEPLAGTRMGDLQFPLRSDAYTNGIRRGRFEKFLRNASGTLDARGHARAELVIPRGFRALQPGTKLHHACVVGSDPFDAASESVETILIP
jgi:hypothetical protein